MFSIQMIKGARESTSMKLSSLFGSSTNGCSNTWRLQHTGTQSRHQGIQKNKGIKILGKAVVRQLGRKNQRQDTVSTNTFHATCHADKSNASGSTVLKAIYHWTQLFYI